VMAWRSGNRNRRPGFISRQGILFLGKNNRLNVHCLLIGEEKFKLWLKCPMFKNGEDSPHLVALSAGPCAWRVCGHQMGESVELENCFENSRMEKKRSRIFLLFLNNLRAVF
jgi:hypothetical protein